MKRRRWLTLALLLTVAANASADNLIDAVILGDGGPRHAEIVRQLIARGANVNLADRQGVTPLANVQQRGQQTVSALLRAAGARSEAKRRGAGNGGN